MNLIHTLFLFHGRLNRKGFWQGVGINFAFLLLVANLFFNDFTFSWIMLLPLLISLWSLSAIVVKRLHDRNRSGKAALILLVPILCYLTSLNAERTMVWLLGTTMPLLISTVLMLEWGCFAGTPEANAYGERGLSLKLK